MKKIVWFVVASILIVQYCAPKQDAAYFTKLGIDKMLYNVENPETEGSYATDAVNYLEKAISLDSTYAPAYANLPYPYFMRLQLGEIDRDSAIEKSRKVLAKAQELAPDHPATIIAEGFIKKNYDNDQSGAINLFKQAIEIDPKNTEAHRELGWSYLNEMKLDLALEQAELVIKLDPKSKQGYYLLGLIHERMGNYEQAIGAFETNLSENTHNLDERDEISNIYLLVGKYDKAEEVARQNIKDYPNFNSAKNSLADALTMNKKYDEALALYKETNATVDVARVNALMGNKEEALEGIIEEQSKDYWWRFANVGSIYIALGEYDKAIEAIEKSLEMGKANAQGQLVAFGNALNTWPRFFPLKDDPRFKSIIAQTEYSM